MCGPHLRLLLWELVRFSKYISLFLDRLSNYDVFFSALIQLFLLTGTELAEAKENLLDRVRTPLGASIIIVGLATLVIGMFTISALFFILYI